MQNWREDATDGDTLLEQNESLHDSRGRVYQRTQYEINGSVPRNKLIDRTWYDCCGNVIKHQPAGGKLFTKSVFDGLARPAVVYTGYDLDEATYADAETLTGDTIVAQSESLLDKAGKTHTTKYDHAGRLLRAVQNYVGTGDPRSGSADQNVTVDRTYTPDGQLATLTALQKTASEFRTGKTRSMIGRGT